MPVSIELAGDWPEIINYINTVAINELRTFTSLSALAIDGTFTEPKLVDRMVALQGGEPTWNPKNSYHIGRAVIKKTLHGNGFTSNAVDGTVYWEKTRGHEELYWALGGLFGQWALDNRLSTQQLLIDQDTFADWSIPFRLFQIYREVAGYPPLPERLIDPPTSQEISEMGSAGTLILPQHEDIEPPVYHAAHVQRIRRTDRNRKKGTGKRSPENRAE